MENIPSPIKVIKKYQPFGYEIIYEDRDLIVGNKSPGALVVSALWNKDKTIHRALNDYVRKGQSKSNKRVFVVHRLDQGTSGVLIFAKSPQVQEFLKSHWKTTKKIYYAIVHGHLTRKEGTIESRLVEDEDYKMHSVNSEEGKLAQTAYKVVKETEKFSLVEIDLLTGRKNQIRVHMANLGHPIVGDDKYGKGFKKYARLALHSYSITFTHPFSKQRLTFSVALPDYFNMLIGK